MPIVQKRTSLAGASLRFRRRLIVMFFLVGQAFGGDLLSDGVVEIRPRRGGREMQTHLFPEPADPAHIFSARP